MIDFFVFYSSMFLSVFALLISFHNLLVVTRVTRQVHRNLDLMMQNIDALQESIVCLQVKEAERMNEALSDEDLADYPVFGYPPEGDKNGKH